MHVPPKTPSWTDHPDLVAYYESHRSRPEELYPSERRFLPWLATRAGSVLDVGCGAGGLSAAWSAYRPGIRYTGVDLSGPLVDAARRAHPEHEFIQADCADGLPLADGAADVVVALGWLHWEERYAQALAELWRVTGRYTFFDLRLLDTASADTAGRQRLALTADWDERTTVPYICTAWPRVAAMLLGLGPRRILGHGYWGSPAGTVIGVDQEVCFATFVLERGEATAVVRPEVALDLPLSWPEELAGAVQLTGAAGLDELLSVDRGRAR